LRQVRLDAVGKEIVMLFVAEPGITLDVLEYNMMFFNQPLIEYRDKIIPTDSEPTFHYFDRFRAGKAKFSPLTRWFPFFRYTPSNYNFFPLFKYFWDTFDPAEQAGSFFKSLRSEAFKRCCFEFFLNKYAGEIDAEGVFYGNLRDCLRSLSHLVKDGEDAEKFIDFLCGFDELIEEIIPYLEACYVKMKTFHARYSPKILANSENIFNESVREIKLMHNIGENVSIAEQSYSVCLMEHFILLCKKLRDSKLFFFFGASGKNALRTWEETLGINLLSVGNEFGNEVKYDIVQTLRKGDRTVSQLSKQLYISRSTVERCVFSLQNAHVLIVSKRVGVETYFKLNPNYFIAAKAKITLDLDNILEDIIIGASSI
jgi:DNA-binding transcriptional ArsR family regulator